MNRTHILFFSMFTLSIILGWGIYILFKKRQTSLDSPVSCFIKNWANDHEIPGIAIALINKGNIDYYIYGIKSIDDHEPITSETIFEIGSITKLFTTLLLMQMVEDHIMQLDDPIENYLPGIKIPEKNNKKITFRHLASHTSGLLRLPTNFVIIDLENPYKHYSPDQLYAFLNEYELPREPGEFFEYSNVGIGLLGDILSKISNKPFETLIKERITNPLRMNSTGISFPPQKQEKIAQGHDQNKKVSNWDFNALQGAGALRSTIKDMARFLSANMGLIDSTLCKTMQACYLTQTPISPQQQISLGWMTQQITKNGKQIIWHNGKTGGFSSFIGFEPNKQNGVIILSNSTYPVDTLGFDLLNAIN